MDPMECARNLAAINALQFQMMPAAHVNTFWPQQTPLLSPGGPFLAGFAPWIPPLPSPFLMGITCDGIPVKKTKKTKRAGNACKQQKNVEKNKKSGDSYQKKSSYDTMQTGDGLSMLPDLSSLENSSSIQSTDTCVMDSGGDGAPPFLEDFDLFTSDFDAFLNELTSDRFADKSTATFCHRNVQIPQRKRTKKGGIRKRLSPQRIRSFYRFINTRGN